MQPGDDGTTIGLKRALCRLPVLLGALFMLSAWGDSLVDDVTGDWRGSSEPGHFYSYEMILECSPIRASQRQSNRIAGVTFSHGTWKGRFVRKSLP